MYQLRRDADGIVLVYLNGYQVIKLEGGAADLIVATYQTMSQVGEHRGNDYMAGVVQGIIHCHMLVPTEFSPLPPVPPIAPG